MKKALMVAVLVVMVALAGAAFAQGPFGFEHGMTREQIVKLVGIDNVVAEHSKGDFLTLRTDGINPHFSSYVLIISPTQGLLKVSALGKNITAGDAGFEVREEFQDLVGVLSQKYGAPTKEYMDNTSTGTQYWMLDLLKKDLNWGAFWTGTLPNHITAIAVDVRAQDLETGYCVVDYEFEGFDAYADANSAKQNQNF